MRNIIIGYELLLSLLLFVLFAVDKNRARRQRRRLSEKLLLGLGLLGGAPGGLLGSYCFRHKTRKRYFLATYLLAIALHGVLLYYLFTKVSVPINFAILCYFRAQLLEVSNHTPASLGLVAPCLARFSTR